MSQRDIWMTFIDTKVGVIYYPKSLWNLINEINSHHLNDFTLIIIILL
jgi:hypothetical protein